MVTKDSCQKWLQQVSMELTKPVKDLAEWNYPFSETLETYYSLFKTSNKGFSKAGLVVQNSTAVYVRRIDHLWNRTDYIRNIFVNNELEDEVKKDKRKNRKALNFQNFQAVDFAKEVDRNIDIKKNITQNNSKIKIRCFTQLEKSIAHNIPIDIYDVNGEIIGKKYDFRCNQNVSMTGVLIDEFAPEDFHSNDTVEDEFLSANLKCSPNVTEVLERSSNTTVRNGSEKNLSSDAESDRNDDDLPEDDSDLITSHGSSKNLSLSSNNDPTDTSHGSPTDISHDQTLADSANESQYMSFSDTNLPNSTTDSTALSCNDSDAKSSNDNNMHEGNEPLDSSAKSIDSQERSPAPILDDATHSKSPTRRSQRSSVERKPKSTLRLKSTPKTRRSVIKTCKKKRVVKNLLHEFQKKSFERILEKVALERDRALQKDLDTCMRHIRQYDPLRYNHATNAALDLLGFRLNVTDSCDDEDNNNNNNDSVMICNPAEDPSVYLKRLQEDDPLRYVHVTNEAWDLLGFQPRVADVDALPQSYDDEDNDGDDNDDDNDDRTITPTDDEMSEIHSFISASSVNEPVQSSSSEWIRSDSPIFLPENIEKWHELLQPKLREAERRSTFCIRDYALQIMQCLQRDGRQKVHFENVVRREKARDVARYFLASLDLASKQNVDLNMNKLDLEISLHEDMQCSSDDQADSHD